jgi:uncharacterized protein
MSANVLHVNAAELLREPGLRRHVSAVVAPADVDAVHESISGEITVEVELESTLDDIAVVGTIAVPWEGQCRRCLRPLAERIVVDVDERYAEQPAAHDDAFPIEHGQLDLAPMVREHVLLVVDEPRLCRLDCPGLCPDCGADLEAGPCGCERAVVDDRWAALDQLRQR